MDRQNLEKFIGLPYKLGGRDRRGIDCWGLVRLVYLEAAGIELPLWDTVTDYEKVDETINAERLNPEWIAVEERKEFDLIEMRGFYRGNDRKLHHGRVHCGVCIASRQVLHIEIDSDSIIVPYNSLLKRAPRAWRHRKLA